MNNSTIISKSAIDILKNMIGKPFDKYKCDPFINSPMVYGIIGIYVGGKSFKLTSLFKEVNRFLAQDEVAQFEITENQDDDIKSFMIDGKMIETPVKSKIKSISIVNDFQTIEHQEKLYKFSSTVGLVFSLEDTREISFELGTWFSEMITIQRGYNLIEKFTATSDFLEEWEDCDGYIPKVNREIMIIE